MPFFRAGWQGRKGLLHFDNVLYRRGFKYAGREGYCSFNKKKTNVIGSYEDVDLQNSGNMIS